MLIKKIKEKIKSFDGLFLIVSILLLLLFSLYLLPPEYSLAGHDSGLPLNAKNFFISRLYAWDDRIGLGQDNSHLFGSLTLHGIDYLSALIGGTLDSGNWFNLFFWLSMVFLASFIFAYQFRELFGKYFPFIYPILITFNFYLFQSIFILERAKYSILVGILLFLTIVFKLVDKKISLLKASILSAFVFFLFNGGSLLGLPLYGSLFVIIFCLLFYFLLIGLVSKKFTDFIILLKFLSIFSFFLILLNSYQIFPYGSSFLEKSYISFSGGVNTSRDWVNYISQNTSLINLFRLQGVPTWWSSHNVINPEHLYSYIYLKNPLFIIISFVFPILAISSFFIINQSKQKKILLLFLVVTLFSMFFVSGTHSPFGFIYGLLYDFVPGFFIFRTPFYKFAGGFFIAYSFLLTVFISLGLEKLVKISKFSQNKKNIFGFFLSFLIICGWIGYHYNLLSPVKVFSWKNEDSTRLVIPKYVWEFNNWANKNINNERILLLPQMNRSTDSYEWGYWSQSPITYSLLSKSAVINEQSLKNEEEVLVSNLYKALTEKDQTYFLNISEKLNIRFLVIRKDVTNNKDIEVYENSIKNFNSISKINTFGKWEVYEIDNNEATLYANNKLTQLNDDNFNLARDLFSNEDFIMGGKSLEKVNSNKFIAKEIKKYECQSCYLESIKSFIELPRTQVLPNSFLYFIKENQEIKSLNLTNTDIEKINFFLTFVLRRVSEIEKMLNLEIDDKYVLSSLRKSNSYLSQTSQILKSDSKYLHDLGLGRILLNVVSPLLIFLNHYVTTFEFSRSSAQVKEEFYNLIENLYSLNDYYTLSNLSFENLRTNKTYEIDSVEDLYLTRSSLPRDLLGKEILPLSLKINNEDAILKEYDDKLFKITTSKGSIKRGDLKLEFNIPNLFQFEKQTKENFPRGRLGCLSGRINNFQAGKYYEINITTKDKHQDLKIYFQDLTQSIFKEKEKGISITPLQSSIPYRIIYETKSGESTNILYVCSRDEDLPQVEKLDIYEIFSPVLASIKENNLISTQKPTVNYTKIDPTKYEIYFNNASDGAILILNQRFSTNWDLHPKTQGGPTFVENQILINGYANAWVLENSSGNFIVEYRPQTLLKIGAIITSLTIVFSILYLFISINKNNL